MGGVYIYVWGNVCALISLDCLANRPPAELPSASSGLGIRAPTTASSFVDIVLLFVLFCSVRAGAQAQALLLLGSTAQNGLPP